MNKREPIQAMAWRRALEPRETAAGFASRLAALNGRPMRTFLREMQVLPYDLDRGLPTAVRAVATLGGADPTTLLRRSPRAVGDGKFHELAGEVLRRTSITRGNFRVCPHCISDDLSRFDGPKASRPWLRLEWTVLHYRSCDVHGVVLDRVKPVRRRFEPFDFNGFVAEVLPTLEKSMENAEKIERGPFQKWLDARLSGRRDRQAWLDGIRLYAAAEFCEALGISALHPPKVHTAKLTVRQWAAAADEGYRIASGGPESIRSCLETLNAAQDRTRGVWGARDTYGYAYGLLQRTIDDPFFAKPREVVRRFAMETLPLEAGTDILGEVLKEQKIHTIHSAAKASGAHSLTMRNLFRKKGLGEDGLEAGLRDHRVTIRADEIQATLEALKDSLTTTEVFKRTGIPRIHLYTMIAQGYLPTLTDSERYAYAKHKIARREVDAMMARLFAGAAPVTEPLPHQKSLKNARAAANASVEVILSMVFEGKLVWKGRLNGGTTYDALLVDATEVRRIVCAGPARIGFSKLEAKEFITGMGRDSVEALIRSGDLEVVQEYSSAALRMVPVISRPSAERFLSTYVALGELTRRTGLHHKQVRMLLRRAGIEAVFDPEKFGTFFYDRSIVESAVAGKRDFWKIQRNNIGSR